MRRLAPALAVALSMLLVACGVPEDDGPQELTADEVPFGLLTTAPTTTSTPENLPPSREAELYFLDTEGLLEPLPREVADRSAATVIETLLATDTAGLPATYSSNIPPDTVLLDIFTESDGENDVLTVDLSEQFTTIQGERFIAAVAQIVFTASDLEDVDAVSFRVDGEPIPVSDEQGAAQDDPVTPLDYRSLLG